eukprot:4509064-Amphidinium_carterae.1
MPTQKVFIAGWFLRVWEPELCNVVADAFYERAFCCVCMRAYWFCSKGMKLQKSRNVRVPTKEASKLELAIKTAVCSTFTYLEFLWYCPPNHGVMAVVGHTSSSDSL